MDYLSGRRRELQELDAFMAQARSHGASLLVTGDPGIGKTDLLTAAARRWTAAGGRVIRSSGVQFEADVSYAGLHQVLSPLLSGLHRLEPPSAAALASALGLGGGTSPDQLSVCAAALTLVRQEGENQPLLVVTDDVPWFDRSSAIVLAFIARRLAGSQVGLLAAARPSEEGFFDRVGLPTLSVGPLTQEAASELLSVHYPALAPPVRQRLLADAAGNPLALLELPAALTSSQRAGNLPSVLPLSQRLQDLFAHRIRDLPESTRSVLLLAALDGSGDLAVLDAAAREAGPAADLNDLAPAERISVVAVDSSRGKLAFRHPLTRSAVVELATSDERRSAHRSLAAHTDHQPESRTVATPATRRSRTRSARSPSCVSSAPAQSCGSRSTLPWSAWNPMFRRACE
jgi:predicted ATPase